MAKKKEKKEKKAGKRMSYGLGYSSDKGGIQVKRGLSVRCVKD